MKKLTLLFIITLVTCNLQAQDNKYAKNKWMLGGNITIERNKYETQTNQGAIVSQGDDTRTTLSPQIGYFVLNRLAFTFNTDYLANNSARSISFQPGLRWYPVGNLYIAGGLGLGQFKSKIDNGTYSSYSRKLSLGVSAFLTPKVAIEPEIYYQDETLGDNSRQENHVTTGLSVGLKIFL